MVVKIDIDDRNLEIIEDRLSMLIDECEYHNSVNKQLKQKGLTEKEIADQNGMNVVDYRRFCHCNLVMKKFFRSIINGLNK